MTDLEITKLCAEAIGDLPPMIEHEGQMRFGYKNCMGPAYDPLHNDAQAMALVKKFGACITYQPLRNLWVVDGPMTIGKSAHSTDLNRAICECVAKMQQAKVEKTCA